MVPWAADQGDADAQNNLVNMLADLDSKNTNPISDTNFGKQEPGYRTRTNFRPVLPRTWI